jgi:hypothetical protein
VLDKLAHVTRERLILEAVGFQKRERAKLGLSLLQSILLRGQPVLYAGATGAGGRYYTPKFVVSPSAIERVLTCHRNTFAKVEHAKSEFKDRFITIAHKRRIRKLIVLAGPPVSDKKLLINQLRAGGAQGVAQALGLDTTAPWRVTDEHGLHSIQEPAIDVLVYDYNFLAPYEHHHGSYERDDFLEVLETASEVVIATLAGVTAQRSERDDSADLDGGSDASRSGKRRETEKGKVRRRAKAGDPVWLDACYARWFEFCQSRGRNVVVAADSHGAFDVLPVEACIAQLESVRKREA